MVDSADSFITAVHLKESVEDLINKNVLKNVREDYDNWIKKALAGFELKVDKTIEQLRNDFLEAYEEYMQDKQRELLVLKNRLVSIEKSFKEDKLKQINAEEERFRNESLRLDLVVLVEAKRLNLSTEKMKVLASEVDWLRNKYDLETRRLNRLQALPSYMPLNMESESLYSESQASSRIAQFRLKPKRKIQIRTEPPGYQFPTNEWPAPMLQSKSHSKMQISKSLPTLPKLSEKMDGKHKAHKALNDLVSRRSIQNEMVTFLHQCESHYMKERALSSAPHRDNLR
jgi:hypothetical protein